MGYLLAIDPGCTMSAYVVLDGYHIVESGKVENEALLGLIPRGADTVVIEQIESYGMAVGREVFDTCVWVGRFSQAAIFFKMRVHYLPRRAVKTNLCNSAKAKDANVRQALIDRFAQYDLKNGKGTKNNRDWFYGFKSDIWAAYAVGVTWLDSRDGGRA